MKRNEQYNYAFLDEGSKREIRRCILKAVAFRDIRCLLAQENCLLAEAGDGRHSAYSFVNRSFGYIKSY